MSCLCRSYIGTRYSSDGKIQVNTTLHLISVSLYACVCLNTFFQSVSWPCGAVGVGLRKNGYTVMNLSYLLSVVMHSWFQDISATSNPKLENDNELEVDSNRNNFGGADLRVWKSVTNTPRILFRSQSLNGDTSFLWCIILRILGTNCQTKWDIKW